MHFLKWKLRYLIEISLKFVPSGQLTINRHWFRWWLGDEQATSHQPILANGVYVYWRICVTRPQWVRDIVGQVLRSEDSPVLDSWCPVLSDHMLWAHKGGMLVCLNKECLSYWCQHNVSYQKCCKICWQKHIQTLKYKEYNMCALIMSWLSFRHTFTCSATLQVNHLTHWNPRTCGYTYLRYDNVLPVHSNYPQSFFHS